MSIVYRQWRIQDPGCTYGGSFVDVSRIYGSFAGTHTLSTPMYKGKYVLSSIWFGWRKEYFTIYWYLPIYNNSEPIQKLK